MARKNWTKKEKEFIINNHNDMSYYELSKILNRSIDSIRAKGKGLKLTFPRKDGFCPWSKEDINFLINNMGVLKTKNIAKKLNRTNFAVTSKMNDLKITNTKCIFSFRKISLILNINEHTVSRHVNKLKILNKNKKYITDERDIAAIAKEILENPKSNVKCSLLNLKRYIKDYEESIRLSA